jgi:hypothetical protein
VRKAWRTAQGRQEVALHTFLASRSCLEAKWTARDSARSWHTEVTERTLRTCGGKHMYSGWSGADQTGRWEVCVNSERDWRAWESAYPRHRVMLCLQAAGCCISFCQLRCKLLKACNVQLVDTRSIEQTQCKAGRSLAPWQSLHCGMH